MSEQPENTPAGSYRIPGQDVSGYLGVDSEYMNSSHPTQEALLTDDERFLFTVPEEVTPGDEESESEAQDLRDEDAEDHDDDEEKSTYVEPTGDGEGGEVTGKETPSAPSTTRPPL